MQVTYKNKTLERICTNSETASRKYGEEMAGRISHRIRQIKSVKTVEELIRFSIGRCHSLKGNRAGQYAMDLAHPYRLVFGKYGNEIQIANIIEIADYH